MKPLKKPVGNSAQPATRLHTAQGPADDAAAVRGVAGGAANVDRALEPPADLPAVSSPSAPLTGEPRRQSRARTGVGLRTHALRLNTLDDAPGQCVGLFCFSNERPLQGVAGLVDWRLCGRLSRMLQADMLAGEVGEQLLIPTRGRFGGRRLFLFGLGPVQEAMDKTRLRQACEHAFHVMSDAGAEGSEVVLVAPVSRRHPNLEQRFVDVTSRSLGGTLGGVWVMDVTSTDFG